MSREFRLGVFVIGGLLIFGAMIFWIGNNRMMFRPKYRLNAEFSNVSGLLAGAQVRIDGIPKGSVRSINLPRDPTGKVRVVMELDDETRRVVRRDSAAEVRTEGLMGDEYLEVSSGSSDAPAVKDNDTLQGVAPVEISDLIKKANGLLDAAGGAVQNVTATASNLGAITSKINNGAGTVGALVNDKKVYENVNQATSELQEDLEAARHNFLLSHFFHKRGYEDSSALTKNAIPKLPSESALKRFAWNGTKLFDKEDTAKLKDPKALAEAGGFLQSNPFGLAVVAGYAGMKGDSTQEKVLTEARAMVVRDYLVKNFKMDDSRVKTIGLGKTSDDAAGVAVLVYSSPPAAENGAAPHK
ncbi:MAG TPA: MlaD family protein [Bryobacteraceae bacterium]|jgi:phospholipid/cholesterol/gamma-HCH transport system substrate-binding protein|nr:MlaD family protein [Bryobacteraceae bacterium]